MNEVRFLCHFIFFSCYFIQYKSLSPPPRCVCVHTCIVCMSLCIYLCSCTLTWSPDQDVGCHPLLFSVVFSQERVSLSPKLAIFAGLLTSKFSRPFCLCSLMISVQVCIAMPYFFKKMNYCKNPLIYVIKFCCKYFVSEIKRSSM